MNHVIANKPQPSDYANDFRERMMLQMCMIEAYCVQQRENCSRMLTSDEAAKEWIPLFAASFNHHTVREH
ncbi:MAG: hypothetical protein JKY80_08160 [Mariprofundaceae bacterium]|nr:hypothetical protein [Mariprofundaceae bacterium]